MGILYPVGNALSSLIGNTMYVPLYASRHGFKMETTLKESQVQILTKHYGCSPDYTFTIYITFI